MEVTLQEGARRQDKVLWNTAKAIESECRTKLRQWEEDAGLKKPLKNPNAARDQAFFIGVGTRVIAYKSHLKIEVHLSERKTPANKNSAAKMSSAVRNFFQGR